MKKSPTFCKEDHGLFKIEDDRIICLSCPWHVLFSELPRWIFTMGRMLMHANCGSARRERLKRTALIENYTAWAEEHGQDKQIAPCDRGPGKNHMTKFTRPEFCKSPLCPEEGFIMASLLQTGSGDLSNATCAATRRMLAAIALDVIFIAGYERKKCPSQFRCQSVNGKGAPNPARRRSGRRHGLVPQLLAPTFTPEEENGERRFRWAWHWCCSKFRAFVSARKRGVLLGVFVIFPPRLLGSWPFPGSRERDDLSL